MMCRHTHAEMSDIIRQCIIGVPQITSLKSSKEPFSIFEIAKLLGHRGGISQSSYWNGQDLEKNQVRVVSVN